MYEHRGLYYAEECTTTEDCNVLKDVRLHYDEERTTTEDCNMIKDVRLRRTVMC
jgi:hypothetical protein